MKIDVGGVRGQGIRVIQAVSLLCATLASGQQSDAIASKEQSPAAPVTVAPADLQWQPAERDLHSERWEAWATVGLRPDGQPLRQRRKFVALCTGLNYRDDNGAWQRTREIFDLTPDGLAVAQYGPHKLIVGKNVNDWVVDFLTSDGVRLRMGPVAVAWFDPVSGKQVVLATVQDAAGTLTGPNEVTFNKAFLGLDASIRISYRRAGMSSDLILHEAPPDPAAFGLSDRSRLELYTEMHPDNPVPVLETRIVESETDTQLRAQMAEPDVTDSTLDFGAYKIGRGAAFEGSASLPAVAVFKKVITTDDGRRVLVESIDYRQSKNMFAALPTVRKESMLAAAKGPRNTRAVPARLAPSAAPQPIREMLLSDAAGSRSRSRPPSVVLDYSTLTGATNVTLAPITYAVVGPVLLYGQTVISGGAILKYTNGASIEIPFGSTISCQTTNYNPAIFTAINDQTVGEMVITNTLLSGYFASTALILHDSAHKLQHLRIAYAQKGITLDDGSVSLRHCQFEQCQTAITISPAAAWLDNVLFHSVSNVVSGNFMVVRAQQVTVDGCAAFAPNSPTNGTVGLTNTLLVQMTNWGNSTFITNAVFADNSSNVFTTLGAGAHYLPAASPYRGAGVGITSDLFAELQSRTVDAPTLLTNTITSSTTIGRTVARGSTDPAVPQHIGYYYPAVDYAVSALEVTNATLTIQPGTVITGFGTTAFWLTDGSSLVSEAEPLRRNLFLPYQLIQEQSIQWVSANLMWLNSVHWTAAAPSARLRFSDFVLAAFGYQTYAGGYYGFSNFSARDCSFRGGTIYLEVSPGTHYGLTNNVIERAYVSFSYDGDISAYNNLFKNCSSVDFDLWGSGPWTFRDNAFDSSPVDDECGIVSHSNNAYINVGDYRLYPTNASDIVLTNFTYTNGPLGSWYQLSADLVDKGSRYATNAGLFFYTTQTNQQREGGTMVDIGFHLIATTNGLPTDTDGDGVPDWQENPAGDGVQHVGDPDWQMADSEFLPRYEPLGPCSRRTPLVFSEIMYHPTNSRNYEFIEIYNTHHLTQDLSGFQIAIGQAVAFTFATNTSLAPSSFLVVCRSTNDLTSVPNRVGNYTNNLPDDSGRIQLLNRLGAVLLDVTYGSQAPWPASADGARHSLVLARPSYGEGDPRAWAASVRVGGSPGVAETNQVDFLRAIKINEFLANPTNGQVQYIELYNHCNFSIDISGCYLAKSKTTLTQFQIPSGTIMPPRGFLAFYKGTNAGQFTFVLTNSDQIFFTSPDQSRVIDSVAFQGQAPGVPMGRYGDGGPSFHELVSPTPGAANSGLYIRSMVISEIMFNPISGNDPDEFVEIYNRGSSTQSLSGWHFADAVTFTFPTNASIGPSNYVVIAKSAANLSAKYTNLTSGFNLFGDYGKTLGNSGDTVTLLDSNSVIISQIAYQDGGRWGKWSDGGGSSLELMDARTDSRLAANWADSGTVTSAWTSFSYTGAATNGDGESANVLEIMLTGVGECLVDDIEVTAAGSTNNLLSNAGFESGASGWSFTGDHELSSVETSGAHSGSQVLHLRASNAGDYLGNRISNSLSSALIQGTTNTIKFWARWLRGQPEVVLRIRGNYLEAIGNLPLPTNLGTPGLPNGQAVTNAGPAIYDASHFPVVPAANHLVVVSARVNDPDGVTNVVLHYRVDPATNMTNVTMLDDGTGGDAVAGDGIFSATIPGTGKTAGTLVAFSIEAADSLGTASRFPKQEFLYTNDTQGRECLIYWGDGQPGGTFGTYRIWMTQSTLDAWGSSSRPKIHNGSLDTTFVYGNERAIYNSGAHYGGSANRSWNYDGPTGDYRCKYSLDFPGDDQFLGSSGAYLDVASKDVDLTFQADRTANWAADQIGLAFNYRRYVNVYVLGAKRDPVYEDAQRPNSDLLNEWYPSDNNGDLFKLEVWWPKDSLPFTGLSPTNATMGKFTRDGGILDVGRYRWNWEKRAVGNSASDYTSVSNLVTAVATDPTSSIYAPTIEQTIDSEQWMRVFAMRRFVGDADSYAFGQGHNMYAYKPQNTNSPWRLHNFDMEYAFYGPVLLGGATNADLFGDFGGVYHPDAKATNIIGSAQFTRAFWRAIQDLASVFQSANVTPVMSGNDAALHANNIMPSGNYTNTLSWIANRRSYVTQQLATVAAPFAVTNATSSSQSNIVLGGTAPVEIRFLRLDARTTNEIVTWKTVTNWSLPFVLTNGSNSLTIKGLDRLTNSIASTNVTITKSP